MLTTRYPPTLPIRSASPTFEPVTLAEAKRQCNLDAGNDAHDESLNAIIQSARAQLERDSLLVCCAGTYTVKRTDWGCLDWFELPSSLRPVSAVSSITYVDTSGTTQTWSSSQYSLDTYSIAPVVRLNYDYQWPTLRGDYNGITITCTAGYSAGALPPAVKLAALTLVKAIWCDKVQQHSDAEKLRMAYESQIDLITRRTYA